MSAKTGTLLSPSKTKTFNSRPKTCVHSTKEKRKFYFTSGSRVNEKSLKKLAASIAKPYDVPLELKSIEDVEQFWMEEKNEKIKERKRSLTHHHNYRSRLNVVLKMERLFVEDDIQLPGKSITEDIDPNFFVMTSGRPIKEKKDIRAYLKDLRNCFLTRLKTGFNLDEILLMEEQYKSEKNKLAEVRNNFLSCLKGFEEFLKEDHMTSSTLLEMANEEEKKSRDKSEIINGLKKELKELQADVLILEERWRNCKMFQKFLYTISPSEWRRVHDPDFGRKEVGVAALDSCLFDRFRECPGDQTEDLNVKIWEFKEEIKKSQPPALYFTDPQQLLNILIDLEKNNLIALGHSKELEFPVEKTKAELDQAKIRFQQDQTILEEEIKFLTELVESEEKASKAKEEKLKEVAYGLFRDLITNEEYLNMTTYVEDTYEDAVAPNDNNFGPVTMIKEIELKLESLLLDLDAMPNSLTLKTTKSFYREQKRDLKEAEKAERKVHQMERLLKRLSKSLTSPKKGSKERRIVRRSQPPEELMDKFEPPRILTKEEKDHLFFFGETDKNGELHKPLCA